METARHVSLVVREARPREIECLTCGAVRVVLGTSSEETGECPRCGYLGWAFAEDLDWVTERAIMNGAHARPAFTRTRGAHRPSHATPRR
jgi:uncharacterized paraquat-inducible protein A